MIRKNLLILAMVTGLMACFAPVTATELADRKRVEVVFVLDTTGSMEGLIAGAKKKIWSIANTIVEINPDADIRMALIGFRDIGDAYVVRQYDMSDDIQGLYGNLMRFQADGGNDTPEAVNEALHAAVSKIEWSTSKGVSRIIFLVGDAPPHMDYEGPKYPSIISKAKKKGIIVNTVLAGNDSETKRHWKKMAQLGEGEYIQIPQDGGEIVSIETPYDEEIISLQLKIDATVVPYGSADKRSDVEEKVRGKTASPLATSVANTVFYSRRSTKEVVTGFGDLIGDITNGKRALSEIPRDELPEALQDKTIEEQQQYIDDILAKRRLLEEEMVELVDKHDVYVAEHANQTLLLIEGDSFDRSVSEVLKRQIK